METLQGVELTGTNRPCGLITIIFTVSEMGTLGGFPYPPAMVRCRRSRQAPHAGEDGADSRLRESRSKLGERARLGFDKRARSSRHQKVSGGNSGGATPDPISNSEVKTSRADGTAGEALWESRSPPGLFHAGANISLLPLFLFINSFFWVTKDREGATKALGDKVF